MVQALDEYDDDQDLPQAMKLLFEMNNNVKQVTDLVENMLVKVKRGEITTDHGLSFLEIKYHMLINYLINLTYIVLRKSSGQKIENDPSIDRLVEIRTVLEKIRPIDYKLRYQIDKLVKTAVTGGSNLNDLTSFKANPGNMALQEENDDDDEDDESSDSDNDKKTKKKKSKDSEKSQLYVPPRHTSVPYDGDDSKGERQQKLLEKAKKRALGSSIIQELKDEYMDTPTEIISTSRAQQQFSRAQKEKEEYEEKYLTRLPITKKEKHKERRLTTLGTLGSEITKFDDISALNGVMPVGQKRKKKTTSKKRHAKKRKFH